MNLQDARIEIKKLKEKLNKWREAYYVLDAPKVDDSVYDESYRRLVEIETMFPELVTEDSPTQLVGDVVSSSFNKVEHKIPMLSLDNAFNENDMFTFNRQVIELSNSNVNYFVEPKIDGISISLIYENGKLIQAVTRGDGQTGEDVTNNVKQLLNIPLNISYKEPLEVRGEIYIPLDTFERINRERRLNGETLFANPRNSAAGSIRQLDPTVVRERGLKVMVYWASNLLENNYAWDKQSKTIKELKKLGFETSDISSQAKNIEEVLEIIDSYTESRRKINYEIDGIVIKVDDTTLYEEIGYTSKFPKWAIAYKFPAEVKETKLTSIFPTVGRTGRITYNAELEAVELAGTIVRAATLHNAEYIYELDLRIGDIVRVKKAGEIIPKVVSANKELRKESLIKWEEAKICPTCSSTLDRKEGEVDQYCLNENCPSRISESIIHFASRDAMNIEGLSVRNIEKFISYGWVKNIADIYRIEDHREELILMDGYKDKSVNAIIESINKSKNTTLNRLLFGLGIRHIGKKTAKDLAYSFKTIDKLMNASFEELIEENDLGEVKSNSLVEFFKNKENINLIKELLSLGVKPKELEIAKDTNSKFYNKIIVITGTIAGGTREEIKTFFEQKGAKVTSSVSSKTDFLICGENPSENKLQKVEKSKIISIVDINNYKE